MLTKSRHVLRSLDRQETNKRNLHAGKRSESIPCRIAHIQAGAVSAHADQDERMHGEKTGNESISSPGRHHVTVEEGTKGAPEHRTKLESLDPQVERKYEKENGNGLVIVAASNRSRDVAGCNTHEDGGEETGRGRRRHFVGQEV